MVKFKLSLLDCKFYSSVSVSPLRVKGASTESFTYIAWLRLRPMHPFERQSPGVHCGTAPDPDGIPSRLVCMGILIGGFLVDESRQTDRLLYSSTDAFLAMDER